MSYRKVSGVVAAAVTALVITGGAYGDTGKSPNGAPGPAGNPNQPAAQPQANGPQGPAGNDAHGQSQASHGQSGQSHGKSEASHGKRGQSHGKRGQSHGKNGENHPSGSHGKSGSAPSRSNGSHANPTPGTPRGHGNSEGSKTNPNNFGKGKITICHATKSVTHPYVEITISVNGLHGHGPADDPRHHAGSWKDIIPAPAGGCPTTVQQQQNGSTEQPTTPTTPTTQSSDIDKFVAPRPEVAATAPATGSQAVLGAHASGGNAPAESTPGASKVLGAQASGNNAAPASTLAAHAADNHGGSLPFTGFQLAVVLIAAAAALLGGFALRRATASSRS